MHRHVPHPKVQFSGLARQTDIETQFQLYLLMFVTMYISLAQLAIEQLANVSKRQLFPSCL
jgi:hypothetical protein